MEGGREGGRDHSHENGVSHKFRHRKPTHERSPRSENISHHSNLQICICVCDLMYEHGHKSLAISSLGTVNVPS